VLPLDGAGAGFWNVFVGFRVGAAGELATVTRTSSIVASRALTVLLGASVLQRSSIVEPTLSLRIAPSTAIVP
jgi:hypothetical protein